MLGFCSLATVSLTVIYIVFNKAFLFGHLKKYSLFSDHDVQLVFVAQVGKTSLILSLVSEEFPEEVSQFFYVQCCIQYKRTRRLLHNVEYSREN
jgi:GTPase SAR1 family protein